MAEMDEHTRRVAEELRNRVIAYLNAIDRAAVPPGSLGAGMTLSTSTEDVATTYQPGDESITVRATVSVKVLRSEN